MNRDSLTKKCSNDIDLVTQNAWEEQSPDIYIEYIDDNNKSYIACYDFDSLETWFSNEDNIFYRWVEKPGQIMDDVGHGGEPDLSEAFMKMYTLEFILLDDSLKIQDLGKGYYYKAEIYEKNVRLGNGEGSFGISQLHGQIPGYTVYHIVEAIKLDSNDNKIHLEQWFFNEDGQISGLTEEPVPEEKDKYGLYKLNSFDIENIDYDKNSNSLIAYDEKGFQYELGYASMYFLMQTNKYLEKYIENSCEFLLKSCQSQIRRNKEEQEFI